jgi:AAA domain-containing protein
MMVPAAVLTDPSSDILQYPPVREHEGSTMIPEGRRDRDPSLTPAPPVPPKDEGCRKAIIPSADLLRRAQARLTEGGLGHYWDRHVRAGAVTLLIGETSAGKTVFLHNLAYHLAAGEVFLGIRPPRPLRVLHVDFESYDEIYAEHLGVIGTDPHWDFFDLENTSPGDGLVAQLTAIVMRERYDVLVVDPLMEAYPVRDENDNAMANTQMLAFRRLARSTNSAVILVHNSGLRKGGRKKDPSGDKFMGRGATARVDRADVSINFTAPSDRERLLTVKKARGKNLNQQMKLRFSGTLGYELVTTTGGGGVDHAVSPPLGAKTLEIALAERDVGRADFSDMPT